MCWSTHRLPLANLFFEGLKAMRERDGDERGKVCDRIIMFSDGDRLILCSPPFVCLSMSGKNTNLVHCSGAVSPRKETDPHIHEQK